MNALSSAIPFPHAARAPAKACAEVAPATGPLDEIRDRRILVLADAENLRYSARDVGARLSYRHLGRLLRAASAACRLHTYFSRPPGDDLWSSYFVRRGWTPHPRDIEKVKTCQGVRTLANSDNLLLFHAGVLASRSNADVVVLASGDGDLVCDLARCLKDLARPRQIVTMSVAGSTSRRLDATRNRDIAANIEIGRDCLRKLDAVGTVLR